MIRCNMSSLFVTFMVLVTFVSSTFARAETTSIMPTRDLSVRAAVLQLAHLLAAERERDNGKLWYREASVIEALLYRAPMISQAALNEQPFEFSFNRLRKVSYQPATHTLSYHAPMISIDVNIGSTELQSAITKHNAISMKIKDEKINLAIEGINEESLADWERSLNSLVRHSRGYQDNQFLDAQAGLNQTKIDPSKIMPTETLLDVREKWAQDLDFDRTPWEYTPVKLVSWPIQKILYEIPAMATSLATESVTRSPLHNLLGAWDEFRGALKLGKNAFIDMALGIRDPKTARAFDGTLELLDASLKLGNSAAGIVKAGISTVAYPIYRAAGGKKSQRVALRGKRAVIVLIDSALNNDVTTNIIDTYGEEIVRSKLKSISDYYCVHSGAEENSIESCIANIPSNIQYLDIVSLQHSGGASVAEKYMKKAVAMKNVKPELLLSIGCYDKPSEFVEGENSLGQEKSSWAVHYYLANMLEKRLRGASTIDASQEAYGESFVYNAVDPISWGAVLMIGTSMEDRLKDGYFGSKPSLMTPDSVVRKTIMEAQDDWSYYSWDVKRRMQLRDFHKKVEQLLVEGKITLKKRTLAMLRDSENRLQKITN